MKYSKKITEDICALIKSAVPNKYAALACGISETLFYKWKQEHVEFLQSVQEAEGLRVASLVSKLREANTPIGWMFLLERVARDEFARESEKKLMDRIAAIEEKLAEKGTA